jgi:geranylgeranyl pyrophosphate synthase
MLPAWYNQYRDFIEDSLSHYLETYFERSKHSAWCDEFKQAVQYSLQGWKKLRAILALEFYLVLNNTSLSAIMDKTLWSTSPDKGNWGVCIPDILRFCMAIEIIHAYSLVHDDLPCMDNDTLRRGKATVWKKYGQYQAVLVWDLLNSLAFEILSEIQDAKLWLQLSSLLSKAVWFHGMLWWQVDDMYFEKYPEKLSVSDLMNLHNKKTWALIKASVQW